MNNKTKRVFSLLVCAALIAVVIPIAALAAGKTAVRYPTPDGYNDSDYQKIIAFLENTDESGLSNLEKLRLIYDGTLEFDPADPSTWGYVLSENENGDPRTYAGIVWSNGEEKRLYGIYMDISSPEDGSNALCGDLELSNCERLTAVTLEGDAEIGRIDVSGCSEIIGVSALTHSLCGIDLTGCTALTQLTCGSEYLTELDLSDCVNLERLQISGAVSELDVSNCPHLNFLNIGESRIRHLDVTMCTELESLHCGWSEIEELNASGLTSLTYLDCRMSNMARLDVTGCTALEVLYSTDTLITDLDISTCSELYFDHLRAEGGGFVGTSGGGMYGYLFAAAAPRAGSEFLGWYTPDGTLVSEELRIAENATEETDLIARFTEPQFIPGDVNGSGAVDVADAVIVMRASMGLIELTEQEFAAGDINGDGQINITDAVTLLRMAMGIA